MSNSERILEFEIEHQRIVKKRDCDFSNIAPGTIGYLKAKFYFSPNGGWSDCRKAASFWLDGVEHAELLDENDTCVIPPEALVTDKFKVSVVGMKNGYKITTNKTTVRQEG